MQREKNFKLVLILFFTMLLLLPSFAVASDEAKTVETVTEMAGKAAEMVEKLNINTASVEALANIPGVGPKIGQAIATYREAHGAFW